MTDHERGIEAATKAWMDDRGIDDRFDHWRGSLEIAISAYLATIEPGKPESGVLAEAVKPLEWSGGYCDEQVTISRAQAIGGSYQVRVLDGVVWLDKPLTQTIYPSVEEAKAAAQEHWESSIMSALSTPPQPVAALHAEPCEPVAFTSRTQLGELKANPGHIMSMWSKGLLPPHEEIPLYSSPAPSLGVDIETLQRRVEELEAALEPFANAIYNDNGDITVDLSVNSEDLVKAYFTLRRAQEQKKDG